MTEHDTAAKLRGMTHVIKFFDGEEFYINANSEFVDRAAGEQIWQVLNNLDSSYMPMSNNPKDERWQWAIFGKSVVDKIHIKYVREL